ncbi:MAG: hypothetical protein Q8P13_01410 [bacterium]|nr:hypothetical protein [bacterium]
MKLAAVFTLAFFAWSCSADAKSTTTPEPSRTHSFAAGGSISWGEAVRLIQDCKVEGVGSFHDGSAKLWLHDGTVLTVPESGNILSVAHSVEDKCGQVGEVIE